MKQRIAAAENPLNQIPFVTLPITPDLDTDMSEAPDRGQDTEVDTFITMPDGSRITRESRQGFGETRQKLAYPERPGYHRHWFNDEPGRLDECRRAGYTQVRGPDGEPVMRVADKTTGMRTYLHEVPISWYKDDLKKSQDEADAKDAAILAAGGAAPGPDGAPAVDTSHRYGKVTMKRA